jgi:hypothetical protein
MILVLVLLDMAEITSLPRGTATNDPNLDGGIP